MKYYLRFETMRQAAFTLASGAFALGLFHATGTVAYAQVTNDVMLVNAKTAKCVTIAGGESTTNNVDSVQFDCDADPSRRWKLTQMSGNVYQIKNVRTGKCLTIAGGVSTENNVRALQFDCDSDPSRTWRLNDVTGGGVYQIQNVKTGKCLTIAGGVSTDNNIGALQFTCDTDLSRRWIIRLKL